MEVLTTVVILSVLMMMGLPQYRKVIERGYWDSAGDVLLAIYAGEQTYLTVNGTYKGGLGPGSTMADWREIYVDKPASAGEPVEYSVTAAGPPPTFIAQAKRICGTCTYNNQVLRIDQDKNVGCPGCVVGVDVQWLRP